MIDRHMYINQCDFAIRRFPENEHHSLIEQKRLAEEAFFCHIDGKSVLNYWNACASAKDGSGQLLIPIFPRGPRGVWFQFSEDVAMCGDGSGCALLIAIPADGENLAVLVNDDIDHIVIRWMDDDTGLSIEQEWAEPYSRRLQQIALVLAEEYANDRFSTTA